MIGDKIFAMQEIAAAKPHCVRPCAMHRVQQMR